MRDVELPEERPPGERFPMPDDHEHDVPRPVDEPTSNESASSEEDTGEGADFANGEAPAPDENV